MAAWKHLLLWCLLAGGLHGQSGYRRLLPPHHDYNYFAHRDDRGFYWISSTKGWYRFDGRHYRHYPVTVPDDGAAYDQNVQSPFFPDDPDHAWFTTYDGLHRLDFGSGRIDSRRLTYAGHALSTDYQVLHRDARRGTLLLALEDHLYHYRPDTDSLTQLPPAVRAKRFAVDTFPDGRLRTIVGARYFAGDGLDWLERSAPDALWEHHYLTALDTLTIGQVAQVASLGQGRFVAATKHGALLLRAEGGGRVTARRLGPTAPVMSVRYQPTPDLLYLLYRDGRLHAYRNGQRITATRPVERGNVLTGGGSGPPWIGVRYGGIWYPVAPRRTIGDTLPLPAVAGIVTTVGAANGHREGDAVRQLSGPLPPTMTTRGRSNPTGAGMTGSSDPHSAGRPATSQSATSQPATDQLATDLPGVDGISSMLRLFTKTGNVYAVPRAGAPPARRVAEPEWTTDLKRTGEAEWVEEPGWFEGVKRVGGTESASLAERADRTAQASRTARVADAKQISDSGRVTDPERAAEAGQIPSALMVPRRIVPDVLPERLPGNATQVIRLAAGYYVLAPNRVLWCSPTGEVLGTTDVERHFGAVVHPCGDVLLLGSRSVYRLTVTDGRPALSVPPAFQSHQNFQFDYLAYLGEDELIAAWNSQELWSYRWTADTIELRKRLAVGADIRSVANGKKLEEYWVGTEQGLVYLTNDNRPPLPDLLINREQLTCSDLYRLTDGRLLLRTERGLTAYDPAVDELRYYASVGGVPLDPGAAFTYAEFDSGDVLLVNAGRACQIQPDSLFGGEVDLSSYVEALFVNGLPYDDALEETDEGMSFAYNRNDLGWRLGARGTPNRPADLIEATLSGARTQRVVFLPGEVVRLPDLPPGDYQLRYRAADATGAWGQPASIAFRIRRPFWQQPLFLLSVTLGLVGVGYYLAYRRNREQLRRARVALDRQIAVKNERDRIAAELHDDLGGDLASMVFLLDGHHYLTAGGHASELNTERLQELAQQSLRNMREMIWVLDERQATLDNLAEQLLAQVRSAAELAGLKLQAAVPTHLPARVLTSTQKRNVTLIIKEAITNVRKHARATTVRFRLHFADGVLTVEISDDGRGVGGGGDRSAGPTGGYGLNNMHRRAREAGGTLTVTPTLPTGTTLLLTLPLTDKSSPSL